MIVKNILAHLIRYDWVFELHRIDTTKTHAANLPYFYCAFTLPNGKRCFKSTKLKDRKAALAFCLSMENASNRATARNLR